MHLTYHNGKKNKNSFNNNITVRTCYEILFQLCFLSYNYCLFLFLTTVRNDNLVALMSQFSDRIFNIFSYNNIDLIEFLEDISQFFEFVKIEVYINLREPQSSPCPGGTGTKILFFTGTETGLKFPPDSGHYFFIKNSVIICYIFLFYLD